MKLALSYETLAKNTIVTYISTNAIKCRVCNSDIGVNQKTRRRCFVCQTFFAYPGEDIYDLIKARQELGKPTYELDPLKCRRPIKFWYLDKALPE